MFSRLQYISQGNNASEQLSHIASALDAGCDWIQFRFKQADEKTFQETAAKALELCKPYKATYIINDHVHIAAKIQADGVHIGLDDMPVAEARRILGNSKIIGGTANTLDHVLMRVREQCDYIGLGPFRFTSTKEKLSPILGAEGYQKIMQALQLRKINTPVYAIGGITPGDVETIMHTGVYGIAVSGIITNAPNKKELVEQLNDSLHANTSNS
ncbi:MAG: thiamine phosphate synthase [Bacteroidetes bacterium]|nr:thiamine phosphate synthase [Bacteroidota bacterium]